MSEEENKEVEQQEVAQEETQQETQASEPSNWERARHVMESQKAEIDQLKAYMAQMAQAQAKQAEQQEVDELDTLPDDEVVTKEQAKKLAEKQAKKAAEAVVQQYMQQNQIQRDEERMRGKYEDYDYVIDNFAAPLIKNDPALAHQIRMSKNPAETAYRLGKLSDGYEQQSMKQETAPKAQKILKNSGRPVSANAVGSPLKSQVEDFSKMSSSQIWEMSQKYARGA